MSRSLVRWCNDLTVGLFYRFAASGFIPARWFLPELPPRSARTGRTGHLHLEIVSHCWQYAHLLVYQLSSLVIFPPRGATVTMTIYYNPEDARTLDTLNYFGDFKVPNVVWNWQPLPKRALFRRAIGRNQSALATRADWIWFTDCDLMFRNGCIDVLSGALQGRRDALVFPLIEHCTSLLTSLDPMLNVDLERLCIQDIDRCRFTERRRSRATGPLQIAHGDVARTCGYCNSLPYYQRPAESWRKAYEDRAFRWLLRTDGTPLDIPGVYRIRHADKGRYTGSTLGAKLRGWTRRISSRLSEFRL
ncbi:MAG: hypothetical protein WD448_13485 [Woeseia sp.]